MRKAAEALHPKPGPDLSPLQTTPVSIDRDVFLSLRSEAAKRSTTVPRLINDLLAATVEARLTRAILDDDG